MLWLLMLVVLLPGMNVSNVTPPLPPGFAYNNGTAIVLANCTPGKYTLHLSNGTDLNVTVLSPYDILKELKVKDMIIQNFTQNVTTLKNKLSDLKAKIAEMEKTMESMNETIASLRKTVNVQKDEISNLLAQIDKLTNEKSTLLKEKNKLSWQVTVYLGLAGLFAGCLVGIIIRHYKG